MKQPVLLFSLLLLPACGGAVKKRLSVETPAAHQSARVATLSELVDLVNREYASIESLSVSELKVEFKTERRQQGYIEEYRSAQAYFVARRPQNLFVNILNPLTKSTLVAMATDGRQFQIWIPRENKYLLGNTDIKTTDENPLYRVRPNHFLDALLVEKIPVEEKRRRYFLEETEDARFKYYVIGVVDFREGSSAVELLRRVWVERSRMQLVRQSYYDGGELISVIDYNQPVQIAGMRVHSDVQVERRREGYSIRFRLAPDGIKIDPRIRDGTFHVPQPPGAQVRRVEGDTAPR